MSKLSIYETGWIDLVFQDRNKKYGAYQLRQDSAKTSFLALFTGVALLFGAMTIPKILNYINPDVQVITITPEIIDKIVQLSSVKPNEPKPMETLPAVKSIPATEIVKTIQLRNPEIVEATTATPDIAKNIDYKNTTTLANDGSGITGLNPAPADGNGASINPIAVAYNENNIVNSGVLDKLPEFPGGISKFYSYVGNNFEKPEIENTTNTMRIFVSFVIEKDGKMTDIQVLKDPGYGLGKEAIRVLKSLRTKWIPGMLGGKAVRTAYNLPISVQMQ
ncbi:protein TonB [Flavobacterium micromati]|uniref:Protein TonB n=1 Tax=Flavobacterium micromati TaxID=229205 RepID=A0A1M5GYJ6_9FLAO|nr:energy transducer TonB [Flavobacterium micromati]SHG08665.1 protein TonB [Flavobacterium micromati]